MKQYLSIFSIDDDIKSNQKRSTRQDYDIIDLFNRNGDAIMQYQAHESSSADKQAQMSVSKLRYSRNLSQEDEMASWFQSKADEVMEKDLYSDFFNGIESAEINGTDNLGKSDILHPRPNFSSSIVNLPAGGKEVHQLNLISERSQKDEHEAIITTSTGGSGCSSSQMGHRVPGYQNQKRKGRDGEEHECQSEETDFEQREAEKPLQLSKSARRNRAAEVHNLSERRRRDRINEKMKALKELIPHCNKSDKATMLDDAIEYLKSLQLQLQFMWMASGMAPMMFPAAQHYMSQMSIQAGHSHMLSLHGTTQPAARAPTVNQSNTTQTTTCTSSDIDNVLNFASQMQYIYQPESYSRNLALHQMQPNPQAMNQYDDGSHKMQQNQTAGLECNGGLPVDREIPPNNIWKDIC